MASSAWAIRVGVDIDTSDIQSQLNKAAAGAQLNLNTQGAAGGVGQVNQKLGVTYQLANKIYQVSKEAITAMVKNVFEVDKALTEFKKVSDLRGEDLTAYTKQLSESGREVARTGSQMIDAATMFRKSGFGDAEAAELAKIAAMFQNIADYISLNGSFYGLFIAVIMPGIIYIKSNNHSIFHIKNILAMIFILALCSIGALTIYFTLKKIFEF